MVKSLEERTDKLLSKTEAMVLLCSKASSYWSMIKFGFNIPLVLTSSAMCIINSISEDANEVKIPNIVVNAISVLIMSLNNSIKVSEKCDLLRRLGQQFLLLSGQIENDVESFKDRYVPLQLNGTIGNNKNYKRNSGELVNIERV